MAATQASPRKEPREMAVTFTVHARLPEEHGTTHCVDVAATDTVKIVLEKVAGELGVDPGDVALYYDGVALGDLEEKVTGTTLGEGSEVEARLSKKEVARRVLRDMGLEGSASGLLGIITGKGEDSWKAMVSQMVLDADEGLDVGRATGKAASLGLLETVKVLLQRVGINEVDSYNGMAPLHNASGSGHLSVVEHLVSHGADINKTDEYGMAPLYIASSRGHLPVVEYLESHGADIDRADEEYSMWHTTTGWTPLCIASSNGNLSVVEYLVSHGAELGKLNNRGETAREVASLKGRADVERVLAAAEAVGV